jgi:hypothetical protein
MNTLGRASHSTEEMRGLERWPVCRATDSSHGGPSYICARYESYALLVPFTDTGSRESIPKVIGFVDHDILRSRALPATRRPRLPANKRHRPRSDRPDCKCATFSNAPPLTHQQNILPSASHKPTDHTESRSPLTPVRAEKARVHGIIDEDGEFR